MINKFKELKQLADSDDDHKGCLFSGGHLRRLVKIACDIVNEELRTKYLMSKEIEQFKLECINLIKASPYGSFVNGGTGEQFLKEFDSELNNAKAKRTILNSKAFKFFVWLIPIVISIVALA